MYRLFALLILAISCDSKQDVVLKTKDQHVGELRLVHSPAVDYPSLDYDEVVFYSVNEKRYRDHALVPMDGKLNAEETIGFAILDSLGNPAYRDIDSVRLSSGEVKALQSIFHLPESKGEITKMECIAYFRDAFTFRKDSKHVAQAQICFECNQVYFSNDTTDLAERFTTDGDWHRLQEFIAKLKTRQPAANISLLQ